MSSASIILNKLYNKVLLKTKKLKIEDEEKRNYNSGSSPFVKPDTMNMSQQDALTNDISSDKVYTTNRNIGGLPAGGGGLNATPLPDNTSQKEPFDNSISSNDKDEDIIKIKEQDEEIPVDPAEKEIDNTADGDVNLPPDAATTNPELNAQQPGSMDLGLGLGVDKEEDKSPHELGRIYELKKIYTRLTSIESYLAAESDVELTEIRKYVSQSIELFEILASNIDSYKDKMDDIIISYYKFLKEIYDKIKIYYKEKSKKQGDYI